MDKKLKAFQRLLTIMDELREQCPWDKKQTLETLRPLTIEETHELADAILEGKSEMIKEELGDVLLHIVFYSRIAREKGYFDIADVCNSICDKLIKRHPHIYGNVKVKNEEEVKQNWEQIKLKEKKDKSVLEGVPKSLPTVVKATRLQEKASGVGFDWDNKEPVWEKVMEEISEFKSNVDQNKNMDEIEAEFGDILFSMINYARFLKINPDNALEKTNIKFMKRFNYLEAEVKKLGKKLKDLSIEEMEEYWQDSKKKI